MKEIVDKQKREALIIKYMPLVKNIIGRMAMRLPENVQTDDLMNAGIMGLMTALEKFDETRNVSFGSYAGFRIRGALLDELRSRDIMPRSVRSKEAKLKRALNALNQKFGRDPTDTEIAAHLDISLDDYFKLLNEAQSYCILSKDNLPLNYCEKHGSYDVLEKIDQNNPFTLLARNELKENLKNTINELPEKEKLVLSLYYYEELTLKEIGLTLGLTESRICQIHSKAILQLRGSLQELRHDII